MVVTNLFLSHVMIRLTGNKKRNRGLTNLIEGWLNELSFDTKKKMNPSQHKNNVFFMGKSARFV